MEWISAEGEERSATFDDEVLRTEWGARLRTALSVEGQWLPTVVDHAHHRLTEIRTQHPDAAGLVIATDHEHARGIASMIERRHGVTPSIALSDDPNASQVIERFGASSDQWIVAVRMISEGVDIPRLRVGVFATTTTTAMFFRQAVGRIARWTAGMRSQRAYMYLPDDPRLRVHAASIAQQRRHSIDKRRERDGDDPAALDELRRPSGGEEQMSLFAALSSTVLTAAPPTDGIDPHEDLVSRPDDMVGYPVDLPPPPPLPGRGDAPSPGGGLASIRTRKQEKESLRTRNADRVRAIVNLTGQSHAQINGELNRLAGIDRITEATVAQLEKRLVEADKWLSRLA
jgi:superfamily II DNA or RNA helicase